jgi:hypothetical protein
MKSSLKKLLALLLLACGNALGVPLRGKLKKLGIKLDSQSSVIF